MNIRKIILAAITLCFSTVAFAQDPSPKAPGEVKTDSLSQTSSVKIDSTLITGEWEKIADLKIKKCKNGKDDTKKFAYKQGDIVRIKYKLVSNAKNNEVEVDENIIVMLKNAKDKGDINQMKGYPILRDYNTKEGVLAFNQPDGEYYLSALGLGEWELVVERKKVEQTQK